MRKHTETNKSNLVDNRNILGVGLHQSIPFDRETSTVWRCYPVYTVMVMIFQLFLFLQLILFLTVFYVFKSQLY